MVLLFTGASDRQHCLAFIANTLYIYSRPLYNSKLKPLKTRTLSLSGNTCTDSSVKKKTNTTQKVAKITIRIENKNVRKNEKMHYSKEYSK